MAEHTYAVYVQIEFQGDETSERIADLFDVLDERIHLNIASIPGARKFKGVGGRVVLVPSDVKAALEFSQSLVREAAAEGVGIGIGITHGRVQDVEDAAGGNVAGDSINRAARLSGPPYDTSRIAIDPHTYDDARTGFNKFSGDDVFTSDESKTFKHGQMPCHLLNHGAVANGNFSDSNKVRDNKLAHVVVYDIERFSSLSQRDMAAKTFELKEAAKTAIRLRGQDLLGTDEFFHASAGDGGALAFRADGIGGKSAWAFAQDLINHADERVRIRVGITTGKVVLLDEDISIEKGLMPVGRGVLDANKLSDLPETGGICVSKRFWEDILDDADKRYWRATPAKADPNAFILSPALETEPEPTTGYKIKKYGSYFLFIFLGYFLYSNLSLFNINELTKNHSIDLYYKIKSPDYPKTHQDNISVVLLDEPSLNNLGGRWPATYEFHAAILDGIARYEPRAIVIGLLFLDDRSDTDDTLPDLAAMLEDIEKGNEDYSPTRVFLAALNADKEESTVISPLKELAYSAVISWPTDDITSRHPLYYPLATGAGRSRTDPSAAFRVYRHLCFKKDPLCASGNAGKPAFQDPMQVFWGVKPTEAPFNASKAFDCTPVDTSPFQRWLQWFTSSTAAFRQNCSYTPSISAYELLDGEEADVSRMIKDRVVFYGAGFTGQSDDVYTPTHGLQRSIFLHAMALDNLLTFGPDYVRWETQDHDRSPLQNTLLNIDIIQVTATFIVSIFSVTLLPFAGQLSNLFSSININRIYQRIIILFIFELLIVLFILLFVFYLFSNYNFGTFDWIGLIILAGSPVIIDEFLEWKRRTRNAKQFSHALKPT